MPMPPALANRPYREVFRALTTNGADIMQGKKGAAHVLPIGLYRLNQEIPGMGYVFTCPAGDSIVLPTDKIFVLASKEWAACMLVWAANLPPTTTTCNDNPLAMNGADALPTKADAVAGDGIELEMDELPSELEGLAEIDVVDPELTKA